ncbi:hypothetical protein SCOR_25760 [Sulfidibacter corallicola]|uniref:Carrier domain-containing protein n=1 Tax=Sulfidibacter corallicola TaxID=2818388 RepID=A0A8A4TQD4_SULCO|nr:hypothetical protein [Sulfidibacter corallicola]QTD52196.1 hypothetical protein J3U87_06960 [Sulfidibacter corallicola]
MSLEERVQEAVYLAVDETNEDQGEELLPKSLDTLLFGENGRLDSLGLVNFISVVEEHVEDVFDATIVLADERALTAEKSPFHSIANLVEYVCVLLREEGIEA